MNKVKFLMYGNYIPAVGATTYYFASKVFQFENYKDSYELKNLISNVPVPKKINDLVAEVMTEIKLENEQNLVKKAIVNGPELVHFGYAGREPGAVVGIPQYFTYENVNEIDLKSLIAKLDIPSDSQKYKTLQETFHISKDAKKYAIAREIFESRHPGFYIIGLLPCCCSAIVNLVLNISQKTNSVKIKKYYKSFIFNVYLSTFWGIYLLYNTTKAFMKGSAEFQASEMGKQYLEGGIELYKKIIKRNDIINNKEENSGKKSAVKSGFAIRLECLEDSLAGILTNSKKPTEMDYVLKLYDSEQWSFFSTKELQK